MRVHIQSAKRFLEGQTYSVQTLPVSCQSRPNQTTRYPSPRKNGIAELLAHRQYTVLVISLYRQGAHIAGLVTETGASFCLIRALRAALSAS